MMSHVAVEDLLKRFREINTALSIMKEHGVRAEKQVNTMRGYAHAIRNMLIELGVDVEEVAWP